ncbi:MAG TPA: sigma-70 family RNA polymerase sigma factor [Armatimonadota bacterium]|jgi:RNA polymerase sigma-70 factor (ECF subfamily)
MIVDNITSHREADEESADVLAVSRIAEEERLGLLVRRFHNGDTYAFDALLALISSRVMPMISRFVRDHDDAQDAFQEVAFQLYRSLPRFRGECKVSTFAYRITINVCLNVRKRLARKPSSCMDMSAPENESLLAAILPCGLDETPERRLLRKERQRMLHDAIQSLPPQFREAIVLADACGMKYEEIAEVSNSPVNTVRTRLKRAREAMRKKINNNRELFGGNR